MPMLNIELFAKKVVDVQEEVDEEDDFTKQQKILLNKIIFEWETTSDIDESITTEQYISLLDFLGEFADEVHENTALLSTIDQACTRLLSAKRVRRKRRLL